MKRFLLFVCTVIAFISCTKFDNEVSSVDEKMPESKVFKAYKTSPDSVVQSRLIEFAKHFYANHQTIPEYKLEWEKIGHIGEIVFDDVVVVSADTCKWCYLLPVVNDNNLVGIVVASIQEDEARVNDMYQIRLKLESLVLKPRLIIPKDADFYGLSIYFKNYDKAVSPIHNVRYARSSGLGESFFYKYVLDSNSYVDGSGSVIVVGGRGKLDETLDYFQKVCGVPFEVTSIGSGYFTLYFSFSYPNQTYNDLQTDAYEFGGVLNNYFSAQGYPVTITPLFDPYGSGGGSGGGGSGTTNPPTNPDAEVEKSIKQNAPKASKIINLKSDLTIEQWKKIEGIFNEMVGINKIVTSISDLGGDNIINLTFNPSAESVMLGWNMNLSEISYSYVSEEFFHAYQRAVNGPPTNANSLSREFEAKLYSYFNGKLSGNDAYLLMDEETYSIFKPWFIENYPKIETLKSTTQMNRETYISLMQSFKAHASPPYNTMNFDPDYGFGLALDLFVQ